MLLPCALQGGGAGILHPVLALREELCHHLCDHCAPRGSRLLGGEECQRQDIGRAAVVE
uniref:Uncharacterized protein n=1 Tax=Arundo donax TaxID=35708 RepID=A0A0A9F7J3_ARUDO